MSSLMAARAARSAGQSDLAVRLARTAHAAEPQEPAALFLLCSLLLEQQDPEANTLVASLEGFSGFGAGWEELGETLHGLGSAAAEIAFRRAAEAYAAAEQLTESAEIAYRLGVVLRRLGQHAMARDAMQRSVQRDPMAAAAWYNLGLLRQDLRDGAGAVEAFGHALAARPDFHEAAFNMGVASQENRNVDAALDAYATAWRLRPDSFGRIAQALVSSDVGRLWLHPTRLRQDLAARHRINIA